MEQAIREYRVWCETGDLMGCASVYKRRAWWTVELEPFYVEDRKTLRPKGFRSKEAAYAYAKEYAETYRDQAIEEERKMHEADGCCVILPDFLIDSYRLQVVDSEEGRTLEEWEI
jgi:hypothetical protein